MVSFFEMDPKLSAQSGALKSPMVSIIVVNWNGAEILPRCLDAIAAQTFTDYEVIVVDNASSDHSADEIETRGPSFQALRLEENIGWGAANNRGARMARGRWLALLNNDAYPEPDWLMELVDAAERFPEYSCFAPRIIMAKDPSRLDGTGIVCHVSGLAWPRDYRESVELAGLEMCDVFCPGGSAALYDRDAYLQVGGIDEIFFSHLDDVDLGFRLRLLGYRCLYVPGAIAEHEISATLGVESDRSVYQVHRNLEWCYVKNMPGVLFWKYLPQHLLANLIFLIHYTLRGQGKAIWSSKVDALRGMQDMLRKRREVQNSTRVEPDEINRILDHDLLSPYILGRRSQKIQRLKHIFRLPFSPNQGD
jgi:GT2 family glycosyltransferase